MLLSFPDIGRIHPGSSDYPDALRRAATAGLPPPLECLGDGRVLRLPLLGLLSSSDTPADLLLPAVDLAACIRAGRFGVIGGFQGVAERLALSVLLGGESPLVLALARGLEGWRVPGAIAERLSAGGLLLLSRFGRDDRRPSEKLAMLRNVLVCSLAEKLFLMHASPGSRTMRAAAAALEVGKRLYCFDHPRNRDLLLLGAWPVDPPGRSRREKERVLRLVAPASH